VTTVVAGVTTVGLSQALRPSPAAIAAISIEYFIGVPLATLHAKLCEGAAIDLRVFMMFLLDEI
jgi:hypothetical protein